MQGLFGMCPVQASPCQSNACAPSVVDLLEEATATLANKAVDPERVSCSCEGRTLLLDRSGRWLTKQTTAAEFVRSLLPTYTCVRRVLPQSSRKVEMAGLYQDAW